MRKTALITGGNRGIGLEVCRQLSDKGVHVLMGCRNPAKAQRALGKLRSESVEAIELDVTNSAHLKVLKNRLDHENIDILVNNAAIAEGRKFSVLTEPEELSRRTMETNFWGAWNVAKIVLERMKANKTGRVVNVSSGLGTFDKMESDNPGYRISKIAMNALTVMLDKEVADYSDILVNAMTPGWVRTHLGGINAERSVSEGAETVIWLCLVGSDGPRGQFLKDREPFPW